MSKGPRPVKLPKVKQDASFARRKMAAAQAKNPVNLKTGGK